MFRRLSVEQRMALDAEALRGFLHRFRSPPDGHLEEFEAAALAYEQIRDFVRSNPELINNYRRSPSRPSSDTTGFISSPGRVSTSTVSEAGSRSRPASWAVVKSP